MAEISTSTHRLLNNYLFEKRVNNRAALCQHAVEGSDAILDTSRINNARKTTSYLSYLSNLFCAGLAL
jgi:hypothetical protein